MFSFATSKEWPAIKCNGNITCIQVIVLSVASVMLIHFVGCGKTDTRSEESPSRHSDSNLAGITQTDIYQVPSGDVGELLNFIERLHSFQNTTTPDEFDRRGFPAMKQAATEIANNYNAEDAKLPGFHRAIAISLYFRVTESGDNPRFEDEEPLSPDAREQLVRDIGSYFLSTNSPSNYAIVAAEKLPLYQERSGHVRRAIGIYQQLGPILANSSDPRCAAIGEIMLGSASRLGLLGKKIEIEGNTVDGKAFVWSEYQNRVVLVDFWSTHCKPCLVELPLLRQTYEKYHKHGFEIVSISLDNEESDLKRFLEKSPVPWTTLYDGPKLQSPMAKRYGVVSLPTCLLVNRSGQVVSLQARGEELVENLGKLLAPN